jgi:hypothetical protein
MNIDEALQQIANTGDPSLQDLAQRAYDLKTALANGQISKSEYQEMIMDLVHEKNINESISDLEMKEYINSTVTALITLASLY